MAVGVCAPTLAFAVGFFSRPKVDLSAPDAFVLSAKALAQSAMLPGEHWKWRTDLRQNLLRDLARAQHLLAFLNLSRIEHDPAKSGLEDMVVAEIRKGLTPPERERLNQIFPELLRLWLEEDPRLREGFAYVRADPLTLGSFARFRTVNMVKHLDVLLDRIFKSTFFAALGSRHAPDLSVPFYDHAIWRLALAVVSFRSALSSSCREALVGTGKTP